jgi:hypothetical protein
MQLDVVKTTASILPWRLAVWHCGRQLFVPHAACRLKREILTLKAELEQIADWSEYDTWAPETHAAVREVLARTDSARIESRALQAVADGQRPRL